MNSTNKPAKKHRSPIISELLNEISPVERLQTKTKMSLASKLYDLISEKGWGKSEFASLVGKQPSEVTKWLSGTHNFTIDTLAEICNVLNIQIGELLQGEKKSAVNHITILMTVKHDEPFIEYLTPKYRQSKGKSFQYHATQIEQAIS